MSDGPLLKRLNDFLIRPLAEDSTLSTCGRVVTTATPVEAKFYRHGAGERASKRDNHSSLAVDPERDAGEPRPKRAIEPPRRSARSIRPSRMLDRPRSLVASSTRRANRFDADTCRRTASSGAIRSIRRWSAASIATSSPSMTASSTCFRSEGVSALPATGKDCGGGVPLDSRPRGERCGQPRRTSPQRCQRRPAPPYIGMCRGRSGSGSSRRSAD